VYVEGPLTLNQWTDKDGATRGTLEVRGSDIKFLSPSVEKATAAAATVTPASEEEISY
jgi:single-stranded DNA-binding protein